MSEEQDLPRLPPERLAAKLATCVEDYEGLFAPLLVVGWDTSIRDQVLDDLAARLPSTHQVRVFYPSLERQPLEQALAARMTEVPPDKQPVLVLLDVEAPLIPGDTRRTPNDAAARLNSLRDTLARRFACPWIIWLTAFGFKDLATRAPDFFDFRRHVFWVDESPASSAATQAQDMMVAIEGRQPVREAPSRIVELGRLIDTLEQKTNPSPTEVQALLDTLGSLAETYLDTGMTSQAAATVAQGLELAKTHQRIEHLARFHRMNSDILAQRGRLQEALQAGEQSVTLFRQLESEGAETYRPELAASLNSLANRLSELGQREAALAAAQEAVAIRRELAQAHPDAFLPDLAMSLNNLANRLANLGQLEAALAAAQEAVTIRRELAQARPETFRSDLAGSLINLAYILSGLGLREAVLAAIQEAVTIRRELVQARPDVFRPDLAMSLSFLANRLANFGQREAALAATQEAAALYGELAQARPDAFPPDLAMSLNNLANWLAGLGQREAVQADAPEAAALYGELAQAHPDVFRPDLAMSLSFLANKLGNLGQREAALADAQEAAAIYRELAQAHPDTFSSDLADSLSILACVLSEFGQREAALAAAREAAMVYGMLVQQYPQAFKKNYTIAMETWLSIHQGISREAAHTLFSQDPDAQLRALQEEGANTAQHPAESGSIPRT